MMHGPQNVTKNELNLVVVTDFVNNCLDLHFCLQHKHCCCSFVILPLLKTIGPTVLICKYQLVLIISALYVLIFCCVDDNRK